jgi:hypothetical protein
MAAAAVVLLVVGRHFSIFADEWTWAVERRGFDLDAFLRPHNDHFVLVPAIVYKSLFATVGLAHTWPYRLALILFNVACAALMYVFARSRLGPWPALVPAALLVFPGSAFEDLLWPFQIAFVGSMAFGLGALVCLDRERRGYDIGAAVLLFLSIACSGVGFAFAVGVGVELLLTRRRRRRLWVAIAPLALFALWYLGYHTSENELLASNLIHVPKYDVKRTAEAFAGIANLPIVVGAALFAAAGIWWLLRIRAAGSIPARSLVGVVGGFVFLTLAALARAQLPEDPTRYIQPTTVFILIAIVPCLPAIRSLSWKAGAALATFLAVGAVANYGPVESYADYRAEQDDLGAARVGAQAVADQPDDPWVAAARDLDLPLLDLGQLEALPPELRLEADRSFIKADNADFAKPIAPELQLAEPLPRPGSEQAGADSATGLHCTPLSGGAGVETPSGGANVETIRAPVGNHVLLVHEGRGDPHLRIALRRIGPRFQRGGLELPPGALAQPGAIGILRFLPDHADLPWLVRIRFDSPLSACLVPVEAPPPPAGA